MKQGLRERTSQSCGCFAGLTTFTFLCQGLTPVGVKLRSGRAFGGLGFLAIRKAQAAQPWVLMPTSIAVSGGS